MDSLPLRPPGKLMGFSQIFFQVRFFLLFHRFHDGKIWSTRQCSPFIYWTSIQGYYRSGTFCVLEIWWCINTHNTCPGESPSLLGQSDTRQDTRGTLMHVGKGECRVPEPLSKGQDLAGGIWTNLSRKAWGSVRAFSLVSLKSMPRLLCAYSAVSDFLWPRGL